MQRFKVKVEGHKYSDLSDRGKELWLPIEAEDEDDAVYRMRDMIEAFASRDGLPPHYFTAQGTKYYLGRVLMGHTKIAR